MSWRLAKSLDTFRRQVNTAHPGRSKASDGTIGDQAHSARTSDHNPDENGVVRAFDLTHDPANGVDCDKVAEALVASRDRRIDYLIWKGRILSSTRQPWQWRPYSGKNKHTKHVHISVKKAECDDTTPWVLPGAEEEDVDYDKLREIVADEVGKAAKAAHDAAAARDKHWVRLFPILERIAKKVGA